MKTLSIENITRLRTIERPLENEYDEASGKYIRLVRHDSPVLYQLKANCEAITLLFRSLNNSKLSYCYAEGKWSLKEVLVHLVDDERIYAYRALRFARNDFKQLSGFDQNAYVQEAEIKGRKISDIINEYQTVRLSTLLMYNGFAAKVLTRIGATDEFKASVRALLYHITGHEINHLNIIRDKYLR